ncbi:MAG: outer membrane beta-barrel protein [bacterium]
MQTRGFKIWLLTNVLIFSSVVFIYAQPKKQVSRFSHKGVKLALGSGSYEIISERGLDEGDGGVLSLGYGFTDRFSLWLSLTGSEHVEQAQNNLMVDFGGLELNIQHKFEIDSRFQPYGKVGLGLYDLQEQGSDVALIGAGINLAFGLDFFFARHFGVGAELMFKKLDYVLQSQETANGDFISDLNPNLNGDMVGFMLTFTIQ